MRTEEQIIDRIDHWIEKRDRAFDTQRLMIVEGKEIPSDLELQRCVAIACITELEWIGVHEGKGSSQIGFLV